MKTEQLQLRVSPQEKREIRRLAGEAGANISAWILGKLFSEGAREFRSIASRIPRDGSYALAQLNEFLTAISSSAFADAVSSRPETKLSDFEMNYLAAMVERAAQLKGVSAPAWTSNIPPLAEPHFGSTLESLRLYLLTNSPAAFRRRNIFVDSSIGDRI